MAHNPGSGAWISACLGARAARGLDNLFHRGSHHDPALGVVDVGHDARHPGHNPPVHMASTKMVVVCQANRMGVTARILRWVAQAPQVERVENLALVVSCMSIVSLQHCSNTNGLRGHRN